MTTYIKPSRDSAESYFVETWYDRQTRCYVTQTKNADWDQIGEADYAPSRQLGEREHRDRVASLHDGRPSVLHTFTK